MQRGKQKKRQKKLTKKQWGVIGVSVVLLAAAAGVGIWQVKSWQNGLTDEKTAAEQEIENINSRDNVLDESDAFEGKTPTLKEKKKIKEEKERTSSKKQEDAKAQAQVDKNGTSGGTTETPGNTEKPGDTDKPEVPDNPGDTEQPEIPEQPTPEKPQLPQVQEPGWTIGIY